MNDCRLHRHRLLCDESLLVKLGSVCCYWFHDIYIMVDIYKKVYVFKIIRMYNNNIQNKTLLCRKKIHDLNQIESQYTSYTMV